MRVFRVQAVAAFGGVDGGGGDQLTFQTSDVIELHVERRCEGEEKGGGFD